MANVDEWTESQCVSRSNDLKREIRDGLESGTVDGTRIALDASLELALVRERMLELAREQRAHIEDMLRIMQSDAEHARAE